jgi:hypothetical protein
MEKETFDDVIREMIQQEAESVLNRQLTENEFDEVQEAVCGDIWMLAQDKINEMTNRHDLIDRNRDAEKQEKYFKVIWKNENAYVKEFESAFLAKTLEDARLFVKQQDFITEYDQYKIIAIDGKVETELETIGEGRGV